MPPNPAPGWLVANPPKGAAAPGGLAEPNNGWGVLVWPLRAPKEGEIAAPCANEPNPGDAEPKAGPGGEADPNVAAPPKEGAAPNAGAPPNWAPPPKAEPPIEIETRFIKWYI